MRHLIGRRFAAECGIHSAKEAMIVVGLFRVARSPLRHAGELGEALWSAASGRCRGAAQP